MTVPGVWGEGRWLVEPETGTGRRLLVMAELEPGEHAPVSPGPVSRPPLLGWALICGSGSLVAIAALIALLIVGMQSPAAGVLNLAIIAGGLATMVLCAVAAARLQDAHQRPRGARTAPPRAPVRYLQPPSIGPVARPGSDRPQADRGPTTWPRTTRNDRHHAVGPSPVQRRRGVDGPGAAGVRTPWAS